MVRNLAFIVLYVLVAACNQSQLRLDETFTKSCSDVILEPRLFSLMPKTLEADKDLFKERLQTVPPVEKNGRYWFGSGCKTHECGINGAAWALDEDGVGVAIILKEIPKRKEESDQEFVIYGATESSPMPLLDWMLHIVTHGRPPAVTMK